jgi:O-antigen/teichoic acid export membrane protein
MTNVIRNVVAFYTAQLTVQPQAGGKIGAFLRQRWRWAWRWGLPAAAVMALLSPWLAVLLRIDSPWPLWAGSVLLLFLFLRPVTDGTLQGLQNFAGLGIVQVLQAFLRLLPWEISRQYSAYTLVGLLAFALMVNMDAIVVKRVFSPEIAGQYGPVVTLGKINLFVPLGIGMVLFPKATQRQAEGRDARPVLLLALAATLLPGLALTAVYFLLPGPLVQTIFTNAYANPGPVLGWVGLATTLYAGINIWLSYALSTGRPSYIYALALIVAAQLVALALFNDSLLTIAAIMALTGLLGNLSGLLFLIAA